MSLILIPQISGSVLPANVHQRVVDKKSQRFIIYAYLGIDLEDRDRVPLCAASPITRCLHRRIGIAFNSKTRSLAAPRPRALPRPSRLAKLTAPIIITMISRARAGGAVSSS